MAGESNRANASLDSHLDFCDDLGSSLGSQDLKALDDEIQLVSSNHKRVQSQNSSSNPLVAQDGGLGSRNKSKEQAIPAPVFYAKSNSKNIKSSKQVLFSPSPIKQSTPPRPRSPSPQLSLSPNSKELKAKKEALARDLFPEDENDLNLNRHGNGTQTSIDPWDLKDDWSQPTQVQRELWKPTSNSKEVGNNRDRDRERTSSNDGKVSGNQTSGLSLRKDHQKSSTSSRSRILSAEDEDAIEDWAEEEAVLSSLENGNDRESKKRKLGDDPRKEKREELIQKGGKGKLELTRASSTKNLSINNHRPSTPISLFQGNNKSRSEISSRTTSNNSISVGAGSSSRTMSLSRLGSKSLTMNDGTPSNRIGSSSINLVGSSSAPTSTSKNVEPSKKRPRPSESEPFENDSSTSNISNKKRLQSNSRSNSPKDVINIASSDSEKDLTPEKSRTTPSNRKNGKTLSLSKTASSSSIMLGFSESGSVSGSRKEKGKGRQSTSPGKQRQGKLNFVRVPSQKEINLANAASASTSKSKGNGKEKEVSKPESKAQNQKQKNHRDDYEDQESEDEFAILSQDPSIRKHHPQNDDDELQAQNGDQNKRENQPHFDQVDEFGFDNMDDFDYPQIDDNQQPQWDDQYDEEEEEGNGLDFELSPERVGRKLLTLNDMDPERRRGYLNQLKSDSGSGRGGNAGSKASRAKGTTKGKTWESTWDEREEEDGGVSSNGPPTRTTNKKVKTSWGANGNFRGRKFWAGRGRGRGRGSSSSSSSRGGKTRAKK